MPDFSHETELAALGHGFIVGVDEVGRGPLAGPVIAAAVRLNPLDLPLGLDDSKKLSARVRDRLEAEIRSRAEVGLGEASVEEIDRLNILQASHLAMCRAIAAVGPADFALVDGNLLPKALPCAGRALIKGDGLSVSIAAASIVAKVMRDRIMVDLAQQYPGYGWERNAGYPSKAHKDALRDLGVTPHHRRSFRPVHNILYQEETSNP